MSTVCYQKISLSLVGNENKLSPPVCRALSPCTLCDMLLVLSTHLWYIFWFLYCNWSSFITTWKSGRVNSPWHEHQPIREPRLTEAGHFESPLPTLHSRPGATPHARWTHLQRSAMALCGLSWTVARMLTHCLKFILFSFSFFLIFPTLDVCLRNKVSGSVLYKTLTKHCYRHIIVSKRLSDDCFIYKGEHTDIG